MKKDVIAPEELDVNADSMEVITEKGRIPWWYAGGAILAVLLILVIVFSLVRVQIAVEEMYTVQEPTVVQTMKERSVAVPVNTTEQYTALEAYVPTRIATYDECKDEPLPFEYTMIGDLSKQELDSATNTGFDNSGTKYIKSIKICNPAEPLSSMDILSGVASRDVTVAWTFCNVNSGQKFGCTNYQTTLKPQQCDTKSHFWVTPFATGKDIVLSSITSLSTKKTCETVTKEVSIEEYDRILGAWKIDKIYNQYRNVTKTRIITTLKEVKTEEQVDEIVLKDMTKTRYVPKTVSFWTVMFS
ncbi:MAG: hypothetical protein ABIA93_05810 [Candidatus Woesearchaeota archaeon]